MASANVGTTSFDLSWNASSDNVGVTAYEVFQNGTSLETTGSTSLAITGLTPGTTYSYTVRAADAAGNLSASSAALSVTTDNTPPADSQAPSVPSGLVASNIGATSLVLNWGASTDNVGVSAYEVFRNGILAGTSVNTSFTLTGLACGTGYNLTVRAVDASGNFSAQSTALTASTSTCPSGTTVSADYTEATITVNGSLSEASWNVATSASKLISGAPSHTVTFGTQWNSTYLFVGVKVLDANLVNDGGAAHQNDAVEIFIDANHNGGSVYDSHDRQYIKAYNSTTLSGSNASGVLHGWAAITGGFTVELAIPWSNLGVIPTNGMTIGLDLAIDDDDNGGDRDGQSTWAGDANNWQSTVNFGDLLLVDNTVDATAPTAPTSLAASNVGQTTVNLSWNPSSDNRAVTAYDIRSGSTVLKSVSGLVTTTSLDGLFANTLYSLNVVAKDAAGNVSAASNTVNFTTLSPDVTPPTVPANLQVTGTTSNAVSLSWTASTDNRGVDHYDIYQGNTFRTSVTGTSATVLGLNAQTSYTFKVLAVDINGNSSAFSNTVSATTTSAPVSENTNTIGIGFTGPKDWEEAFIFADAMMSSRRWDSPAGVDANGWPRGDGSVIVAAGIGHLHGKYKLRYEGQATVSISSATITNVVYNASTNTTTADVTITNSERPTVQMTVSNSANGIRKVKLMRPITPGSQQSHDFSELVHREIKSFVARGFNLVRFMDLMGTNSDTYHKRVDFNYRLTPNYVTQAADWDLNTYVRVNPATGLNYHAYQGIGAAFEYVIMMCNEMQVDCWINISHCASDDRIRKVAQLFKYGSDGTNPYTSPQANPVYPPLNPNLKLYVEYSNEVWNWRFPCTRWVEDIDPINSFAVTAAIKAVNVSNMFRDVFGNSEMMTRVRPLFEWQKGKNDSDFGNAQTTGTRGLMWVEANMPQPVDYYFFGGGGSGYYQPASGATVQNLWESGEFDAQNWVFPKQEYMAYLTSCYGLRRCVYEGGPSFGDEYAGSGSNDLGTLVLNDPRLGDEIVEHTEAWNSVGGGAFANFTLAGDHRWGWINEPNVPNTKILGAEQVKGQPRNPITLGARVTPSTTATVPGGQWRFSNNGLGGYNWRNAAINNGSYVMRPEWVSYHFHVTTDGTYKVRVNYKTTSSATLKVYEGSTLLGTLSLANSNGAVATTQWLNFSATIEFLRAIRVEKTNGNIEIVSVEIAGGSASRLADVDALDTDKTELRVFPNPGTGVFQVAGNQGALVTVLNAQGVWVGDFTPEAIDLSHLPHGLYLFKTQNLTLKVVKE
ncbi:MAG: hypothetical protein HC842_00185 [Cytophagales bacterium]|nr:hypothetical protein [Cytophagales bacterium]